MFRQKRCHFKLFAKTVCQEIKKRVLALYIVNKQMDGYAQSEQE
jgi:hypothetical protein